MAEASTEGRVKEIICEQLGVSEDEVNLDSSFIEDLGADSLDIVELVMALEEEYNTEISDEQAEKKGPDSTSSSSESSSAGKESDKSSASNAD